MSDNRKLGDPFNPQSGEFAKNIRSLIGIDDTELRASLRTHGWHPELPAIVDEKGVTIVGHRRLKLAKQLNIKPVIKRIKFGKGDAADAERVRLALVSNIGFAPLTKEDRKHIAEYLYGSKEWTIQAIAKALNVSQKQISRDLSDLDTTSKSKSQPKTASNPKGSGRRKGGGRRPRHNPEAAEQRAAELILDHGKSLEQAMAETDLAMWSVSQAVAREEGRREATGRVDPAILSMAAQEKLNAAIRQHKRKADIEFEMRVLDECQRRLNEISLPHYAKRLEELERLIRSRKGIMDRITYKKILACLHPDRIQDQALKKRYEEAFRLFTELEKRVLDEKESPTEFTRMPRTYAELMAMKAKVAAERKAARSAKAGIKVRT